MLGVELQLALPPFTELTWRLLAILVIQFSCEGAFAERGRKQNQEIPVFLKFPGDVSKLSSARFARFSLHLFGLPRCSRVRPHSFQLA